MIEGSHLPVLVEAALTSISTESRTALGKRSQASTTVAKSGSFDSPRWQGADGVGVTRRKPLFLLGLGELG